MVYHQRNSYEESRRNSYQAAPAGQDGKDFLQSPTPFYHRTPDIVETLRFTATDQQGFMRRGLLFKVTDGRRKFKAGTLSAGKFRHRMKASNLLRYPVPAIALQAVLVGALEQHECREICVEVYEDTRRIATYTVPFTDFQQNATELDRAYGLQLALPLSCWQSDNATTGNLFEEGGES